MTAETKSRRATRQMRQGVCTALAAGRHFERGEHCSGTVELLDPDHDVFDLAAR
jgi:hypothetical protein